MSVYRDSYDDRRSVVSGRTTGGGTKVTRYVVKEDDDYDRRTNYDAGRRSTAGTRYDNRTEIDIRDDDRYTSRDFRREPERHRQETITIRRDESPDRPRDRYWERPPGEPVEERELVIRRTVERDNDTRALSRVDDKSVVRADDRRESRFSDYEVVSPQRGSFDDREREVQRYIRTTDYYNSPPQQQPQTIIIRQEPIIIRETRERSPRREERREERRDEDFQIVKKSDIDDERSVSRRSRSEHGRDRDEEYFYEKKVRERLPDDRDDRRMRRPVSPHDSISQVGRRGRDRGYSSDDSMVYVRKERIEEDEDDGHRGRDLAAGALAGVGAAELIRNHNRKEGKDTSNGIGRFAKDGAAGIAGAVVAEGIRRYRSKSRRRSRSDSRERGRGYDSRDRSRSRSESHSRLKGLGGIGLAAAAVAAGALIANRNKNKEGSPGRSRSRSRSRGRSQSRASSRASAISDLTNDPTATDDRNPKTRNKKTAIAGAVGAAAAALYAQHRSKSRGRGESSSRVKKGAEVVGGGLAAAALAHLYERRKAKDEATDIVEDESRRSRSRHRSRSRPRNDSVYTDGPARGAYSDPNLIQYGNEPLYGNNYGEGYYGRAPPEQDYYQNQNRDIVPAPAATPTPRGFDAGQGRTRSVSSSRSRSRGRGAAAAAAAVGAGVAASEYDKRRQDKKERKRRSRQRSREGSYTPTAAEQRERQYSYAPYAAGRDPYEDANWHATHSQSYAQGMQDPYASQSGFPPPPGPMPQGGYAPPPGQSYGPQDFPPPPPNAPQAQQYDHFAPGQNPYQPRRGDDNVSAAFVPVSQHHSATNGVLRPIAIRPDDTDQLATGLREMAMTPPNEGPAVTVQRPPDSTPPAPQPRTSFPNPSVNPFHQPFDHRETHGSGTPSPGDRTPIGSRAAKAYTPTPPLQPREPPLPQPSPFHQAPVAEVPVVTDAPTPLAQNRPQAEHPAARAFREAAYNGNAQAQRPIVSPPSELDSTAHDRVTISPEQQPKQPEMQQTKQRASPFIKMPSPDPRPPSDDSLPIPRQPVNFTSRYQQPQASMPSLYIPEAQNTIPQTYNLPQTSSPQTYVPPQQEQSERRDRSRSRSQARAPPAGVAPISTTTSRTVTPEPKKSVAFGPVEFQEAPKPRYESEESPEASRSRHSDRDRERDGSRSRSKRDKDKSYEAGDDFSDDTPFEDSRRRSHSDKERDRDRERDKDRGTRHSSRRERRPQSLDREAGSSRDKDRDRQREPKRSNTVSSRAGEGSGRSRSKGKDRDDSPGSDATEDLPERFDEKGRPKKESYDLGKRTPEEDLIAQGLDKILDMFVTKPTGGMKRR